GGELTDLSGSPVDVELARVQHSAYERCLAALGCTIVQVDADPDLPDSVFIEDAAVVVDEAAVVTRPGAPARRAETAAVAELLGRYRPLLFIDSPGTMDGGDVLVVGRRAFVGCSTRTNAGAIEQMRRLLRAFGYTVEAVTVGGCLHLKSAVTVLADDRLLINRRWVAADAISAFSLVDVHPDEPGGANALRVGDAIVYPSSFSRTAERLDAL